MLAKKTYKNQITIPKEALKNIVDAEYFDVCTQDGNIILKPVIIQNAQEHLARIRSKIRALGMTEKDIDAAIHWTRERSS